MTLLPFSSAPLPIPFGLGLGFAAGVLVGALHFLTLRRSVSVFAAGQSLLRLIGAQVLRIALSVGALSVIALTLGGLPLLAAGAGFLVARAAIFRGTSRP